MFRQEKKSYFATTINISSGILDEATYNKIFMLSQQIEETVKPETVPQSKSAESSPRNKQRLEAIRNSFFSPENPYTVTESTENLIQQLEQLEREENEEDNNTGVIVETRLCLSKTI